MSAQRQLRQPALAGAIALMLGWACGNPSGQGSGCQTTGSNVVITAQDNLSYDKSTVNLAMRGQRVCWQNRGTQSHTVTATSASPPDSTWTPATFEHQLNRDLIVTRTFSSAGQYLYHCAIHPGMQGTINVP